MCLDSKLWRENLLRMEFISRYLQPLISGYVRYMRGEVSYFVCVCCVRLFLAFGIERSHNRSRSFFRTSLKRLSVRLDRLSLLAGRLSIGLEATSSLQVSIDRHTINHEGFHILIFICHGRLRWRIINYCLCGTSLIKVKPRSHT